MSQGPTLTYWTKKALNNCKTAELWRRSSMLVASTASYQPDAESTNEYAKNQWP